MVVVSWSSGHPRHPVSDNWVLTDTMFPDLRVRRSRCLWSQPRIGKAPSVSGTTTCLGECSDWVSSPVARPTDLQFSWWSRTSESNCNDDHSEENTPSAISCACSYTEEEAAKLKFQSYSPSKPASHVRSVFLMRCAGWEESFNREQILKTTMSQNLSNDHAPSFDL